MDIVNGISSNPAAYGIAGLWAFYEVANRILQNYRGNKQQAQIDAHSAKLIENLTKALEQSISTAKDERDRADRLAQIVNTMSQEAGGMKVDLRYSEADRQRLREEVIRFTTSIEQLVLENRNKDKSITLLVAANRQILRAIGSSPEALSGDTVPMELPP